MKLWVVLIKMKISWIRIEGFRNYDNETINLADKTLIIGGNDVGKTNMIYALRLLFDKSLSDKDLELNDSDYNTYTKNENIKITVCLDEINEDCLKSIFVGDIEGNSTIIQYQNSKKGEYTIYSGPTEEMLEEKSGRFYLKRLNLEYVNSNRDLVSFIKKTRTQLLDQAKEERDKKEEEEDLQRMKDLQEAINKINNEVDSLNYVDSSLSIVNKELEKLSINNEGQVLKFSTKNSNVDDLLDNLELTYSTSEGRLKIGGDGRNNQIYLATWVAKQNYKETLEKVTIFAIEEPEAHLHPHQQRKLSKYLSESFNQQIFITTHSPQIASEFKPDKIVRLYQVRKITKVAKGGCSNDMKLSFNDFGYRINAISSEIFFSNAVFLVEGPSEKLFYTSLARDMGIDLDRYNISILVVDGVGFKPYIKICQSLNIEYVMRTDDDIFEKTKKKVKYEFCAGISRVVGIYKELIAKSSEDEFLKYWELNKLDNEWLAELKSFPKKAKSLNEYVRNEMKKYNIFLSYEDLERDLVGSKLYESLSAFYDLEDRDELIYNMQLRKAENMMGYLEYLNNNNISLNIIEDDVIADPIKRLKELVERGL